MPSWPVAEMSIFFYFFFLRYQCFSNVFGHAPLWRKTTKKNPDETQKKNQVKFSFFYKTSLSLIAFFSQGENASQLREPDFTDILSFSWFQNPDLIPKIQRKQLSILTATRRIDHEKLSCCKTKSKKWAVRLICLHYFACISVLHFHTDSVSLCPTWVWNHSGSLFWMLSHTKRKFGGSDTPPSPPPYPG